MASVLVTVAEKVKDLLVVGQAAEAFSTDITPVRKYDAVLKLEASGVLHCDVVPITMMITAKRGNLLDYNIIVHVAIRYGFVDADRVDATGKLIAANVDAYLLLLEEINAYAAKRANRTLGSTTVFFRGADVLVWWDAGHLNNWSQYTGITQLTYQQEVSIA